MSALSNYLEKALLDHLLGVAAYTPVATSSNLYLALFTTDPLESGVVGEVSASGTAYARVAILNNATNFPPCVLSENPTKLNGTVITFPTATAAWGTVTHWAIFDSTGSTNALWHGPLAQPRTIATGNTPRVAAGTLQMSFANSPNGGLTAFSKRRLLDLVFGATPFTCAAPFAALGTALTGETLTPPADSAYVRFEAVFGDATIGDYTTSNNSTLEFTPTATTATVTLTHFGLYDSATAGNALIVGILNSSAVVEAGNTVQILDGSLSVTLQ